ncbi:HAMP domain-containing histidine kinase [Macrococcus equipercicus]|uniref:histidine kinase n=1 Tax=Macrococcus equipercicus TaxID=69967 RepID=A0ABQ6RC45_9STAP|nr:HAMP domain-containing sensor histidine kinase [Macrococcus equipercicus]KAA1042756.1 HAMP domain-containing histidine kinase [Macrococcus equipercicus]
MFNRLSTQFIVSTLIVMLLSSLLAFLLANVCYHSYLKPMNDARITHTLARQKQFIEHHPDIDSAAYFNQVASLNFQVMAIKDGQKRFYGTPFRVDNLTVQPLEHKIYHGIKNRPFNLFITGFFDNETKNTVGRTLIVNGESYDVYIRPDVGQSMGEFRVFLAILLVLIVLFSIFFVLLSSIGIVSPVVKLKSFAERIRSGDYSDVTAIKRRDEIGVLAREMEEMSRAIKRHQEMNERFVANVSHEIQSPITNLLGLTHQLKDRQDSTVISAIEHQSERLSRLTKQLLLLAAIDNEGVKLKRAYFNGRELLQEVIQSMLYQLDLKEQLAIADADDIMLYGHRDLLFQLVTNLLSNAIKYSPAVGEIRLSLKLRAGHTVLQVSDNGRGMTDDTRRHLFERFYKADTKEDETLSNGLGMAIVHEIAVLHGAELKVDSELNGGTIITVIFPAQ